MLYTPEIIFSVVICDDVDCAQHRIKYFLILTTTSMPVPSFLSSFADKIQGSPLANRSGESSSSVTHNIAATINHQFRTLQQQYGHVSPSQKIITTRKGVALDYGSLSRDLKSSSKEIYLWGQAEPEDIKDGKSLNSRALQC
jgi:hypothetical protein